MLRNISSAKKYIKEFKIISNNTSSSSTVSNCRPAGKLGYVALRLTSLVGKQHLNCNEYLDENEAQNK
jgi:hypothetical protein